MKKFVLGLALLTSISSFASSENTLGKMGRLVNEFSNISNIDGIVYSHPDEMPVMVVTGTVAEKIWKTALENGFEPVIRNSGEAYLWFHDWACEKLKLGISTKRDILRVLHPEINGNYKCQRDLY